MASDAYEVEQMSDYIEGTVYQMAEEPITPQGKNCSCKSCNSCGGGCYGCKGACGCKKCKSERIDER